ncbi:MAG: type II secretion system minor pseudopilin GspI [Gammaproteobacteria bacterium]|nr:type II secretion system minor pseudopilin GspI [Gammaproteobacteria bacterium]NVK86811.1 type II secretion system minor pseudopilin GspI [Gammaproteobacteria bacterium]
MMNSLTYKRGLRALNRYQGFTLLELLIALVIVATSLAALNNSLFNSTLAHTRQIERTYAHYVARNRLGEMKLDDPWPGIGTTRGNESMLKREWTWKQEVSKTTVDALRRVDISVSLKGSEEYTLATFTAFVSRPPEQDPRG